MYTILSSKIHQTDQSIWGIDWSVLLHFDVTAIFNCALLIVRHYMNMLCHFDQCVHCTSKQLDISSGCCKSRLTKLIELEECIYAKLCHNEKQCNLCLLISSFQGVFKRLFVCCCRMLWHHFSMVESFRGYSEGY